MPIMKYITSSLFIFLITLSFSSHAQEQETNLATNIKEAVTNDDEFNPRGYFTLRPDFRRCISPLCGGVFVKKVNRRKTRCADGTFQNECYVAEIDWKALGFNPLNQSSSPFNQKTPFLVQGRVLPKKFEGFGNLGVFKLKAAFRPASSETAKKLFVGIENNGIVCITSPCFSYDEHKLNSRRVRSISGFDLSRVNASSEDIDAARKILANGGVLLASGVNQQTQEQAGIGLQFIANQFFLPIEKE